MSEQNNPGEPQQHANADTAGVDPVAETDADHEAVTGADAAGRQGHGDRANHSGWQADQYDEHGHGGGGR